MSKSDADMKMTVKDRNLAQTTPQTTTKGSSQESSNQVTEVGVSQNEVPPVTQTESDDFASRLAQFEQETLVNKDQESEQQVASNDLAHRASLEEAEERDTEEEQDDDLNDRDSDDSYDKKIEALCRKTIATFNDTFKSDILELDQSID